LRSEIVSRGSANIALVIDTLGRGGAERVLISLANGLDPRRFRVHVITTRAPGPLACELASEVSVHSLNRRTRWDVLAIHRFARLLDQNDIRLVHTHSHTAAYFAQLARKFFNQRWLHVVHDHYGPIERSTILRVADRLLLRRLDYYFAVSGRLERYAASRLALPPGTWERLPNGVAVSGTSMASGNSVFTIAQVANLSSDKNQHMALAVAKRLRAELPAFRWLLIGDADTAYGRSCRRAIDRMGLQDDVALLGARGDVANLLGTTDVGVLTSRSEALPMALLEYMVARLPVVVTDVGDCGAVVRASGGGSVVACDDIGGFATALRHFALNRGAAERAGAANYRHVRDHYSVEAMVARVADVYDALLSGKPVTPGA
jgi:glycosyltransferase involved in cell wall biosynthesis